MKTLLQDLQTGLYLDRRRKWTQDPKTARAFMNRFRAQAYKVWHRLPRACAVSMPAGSTESRLPRRSFEILMNQADGKSTVVEAKLELGPGNRLFIRGEGEGLTWDKGQPLARRDREIWSWHSAWPKARVTFQLLLNDLIWAKGDDIVLEPGSRVELVPDFEWPEIPRVSSSTPREGACLSIYPDALTRAPSLSDG